RVVSFRSSRLQQCLYTAICRLIVDAKCTYVMPLIHNLKQLEVSPEVLRRCLYDSKKQNISAATRKVRQVYEKVVSAFANPSAKESRPWLVGVLDWHNMSAEEKEAHKDHTIESIQRDFRRDANTVFRKPL